MCNSPHHKKAIKSNMADSKGNILDLEILRGLFPDVAKYIGPLGATIIDGPGGGRY